MGTHPIFESDFDCLTEMKDIARNRYFSLIGVFLLLLIIEFNYVSRTTITESLSKPTIASQRFTTSFNQTTNKTTQCTEPHQKVVFLKTHKTASSTVQNTFFRYGDKHGLNFALPKNNGARFSYPNRLQAGLIKSLESENDEIDILCNHAVANKNMRQIIPGAKLITIVRSVPSLYESSFGYFKNEVREYKQAPSLESFYAGPETYYSVKSQNHASHFAHNHLAFDLGYNHENSEPEHVEQIAHEIVDTYDLILISDYFFESMILLKTELCWKWVDVVFLITNQRQERTPLSPELSAQILAWNAIDAQIFAQANTTFWRKYNALENVEEMRREFQEQLDMVKNFCILTDQAPCPPNSPKCSKAPGNVALKGFELKAEAQNSPLCNDLVRPELAYTKKLFQKQWPSWKNFYG